MRIARIDEAFEQCESHLSRNRSNGMRVERIETLLTQCLLILIYAEFEKQITLLLKKRSSSVSDKSIQRFLINCADRVFRSLQIGEIAGLLALFDTSCKKAFTEKLDNRTKNMYSNILTNRNLVAHEGRSNASFNDVKQYYEEGHVVLDYFRDALFKNSNDTNQETIPSQKQ